MQVDLAFFYPVLLARGGDMPLGKGAGLPHGDHPPHHSRPLEGVYPFLSLDALVVKVREGGRICNVAAVQAVGVSVDGRRESLGLEPITGENGAGWTAFLRGLVARGLAGVALVTSDAHQGLIDAIAATLPGAS